MDPLVIVPLVGQSKDRTVVLLDGTHHEIINEPAVGYLNERARKAGLIGCHGHRDLDDFCTADVSVLDTRLLLDYRPLGDSVGSWGEDLRQAEEQFASHLRACRNSQIDTRNYPLSRLVPSRVIENLLVCRAWAIWWTLQQHQLERSRDLETYLRDVWPVARALRELELAGIFVNHWSARRELDEDHPSHVKKFLREMASSDGYVHTLFDPVGGKTGRIGIEDGFNCMGIPHGQARKHVISRHLGGQILTFDYNAIDYRSIVASVEDPAFRKVYEGAEDFHGRTAEFLATLSQRDVLKQFTYVCVYGGSDETIAGKTGLPLTEVRVLRPQIEKRLKPVLDFRRELAVRARLEGHVTLPDGRRVTVEPGDHDGKVIGLYAQGFSSVVFRRALVKAVDLLRGRRSRMIFTVHDEVVVDLHPDDEDVVSRLKKTLEESFEGFRFVTKVRRGGSYSDATDRQEKAA